MLDPAREHPPAVVLPLGITSDAIHVEDTLDSLGPTDISTIQLEEAA